jgi:hypothetical protein
MNAPENQVTSEPARVKKRSFLCRIILSMALTYFLILAFLFLAGLVFSRHIFQVIISYYSSDDPFPHLFRWFIIAGAALFSIAAAGIILMLFDRKVGFYIFFVAALVIFALDLAFLNFDWLRYLIHTGFIFILGIAHFSRRCYD